MPCYNGATCLKIEMLKCSCSPHCSEKSQYLDLLLDPEIQQRLVVLSHPEVLLAPHLLWVLKKLNIVRIIVVFLFYFDNC